MVCEMVTIYLDMIADVRMKTRLKTTVVELSGSIGNFFPVQQQAKNVSIFLNDITLTRRDSQITALLSFGQALVNCCFP